MGNEQDGSTALLHLFDATNATVLEDGVAHSQRFIDYEDLRRRAHGDGKSKPYVHTARVRLYWLVDELSDLRKSLNLRKSGLCFTAGESKQGSVQINVFQAGEFGVETGA